MNTAPNPDPWDDLRQQINASLKKIAPVLADGIKVMRRYLDKGLADAEKYANDPAHHR